MTRISNDTGRAFEFLLTERLLKFLHDNKIKAALTTRAQRDNTRDKHYFSGLPDYLKQSLTGAGEAAIRWISKQDWLAGAKSVKIDRLPDTEGVRGSVTDIQLQIYTSKGLGIRNISLKHHHNALKHPRLPSLPYQCGIKDPKIASIWKEIHDKVWDRFYGEARKLDSSTTEFRKLKAKDPKFIDEKLYKPLIGAVIGFLKKHANNPKNAAEFFKFLKGGMNFFTIKNEPNRILVKKFAEVKLPTSFKIIYPYKGTLTTFLMEFDNGWRVTLRLHTASSEFFRRGKIHSSTKFDVLCENLEEVIEIDKVTK